MNILGWSRGKNRKGDETGIWHLILSNEVPPIFRGTLACGGCGGVSGQVEALPIGAHTCLRCATLDLKNRLNPSKKAS